MSAPSVNDADYTAQVDIQLFRNAISDLLKYY
jgi:hypothetical protein